MPLTKYEKQHQQRKVGAVKKASGIQDTLVINEALADNGNDAKKACQNFGCVVREHSGARPNYELRSQASIEAHEEKMQAIQKQLKGPIDKATFAKLEEELLNEARTFNQRRNQHNKFDLHYLTVNVAVRYAKEIIDGLPGYWGWEQLHKWHLQHQKCHNGGNPIQHDQLSCGRRALQ